MQRLIGILIAATLLIVLAPAALADIVITLPAGGDGPTVGDWDPMSKTLTLTSDVTERIRIEGDGITLDGKDPVTGLDHSITNTSTAGTFEGILISSRLDVTVKNCILVDWVEAIRSSHGGGHQILDNTITGPVPAPSGLTPNGIRLWLCHSCTVTGNNVSHCVGSGIWVEGVGTTEGQKNCVQDNEATHNGVGIAVQGDFNVVHDNDATNNSSGISVLGSWNVVTLNRAHDNSGGGISLNSLSTAPAGDGNRLEENVANDNQWGFSLRDQTNLEMLDCTACANATGILLVGAACTSNSISRNCVEGSTTKGITIGEGAAGNLIYDNKFVNDSNVFVQSGANTWNVAQQPGPNVIAGPYIGGNFWGDPDGDGYSDTCNDVNGNGFCDSPFVINVDNVDNLPLVENTPAFCNATGGGVYECNVADVTLGGSVVDNDGDLVSYEWRQGTTVLFSGTVQTIAGGTPVPLPTHVIASEDLGLGVHTIELAVEDDTNDEDVCQILVEVLDTTDPTMAPDPDTQILWPPNHQMETVTIQANANDACDGALTLDITVGSDEPENGLGDGDTDDDWQNLAWDDATGEITVDLRSERSGTGDGRVYTITIVATDASGNSSTSEVTVLVPHSRGKGK